MSRIIFQSSKSSNNPFRYVSLKLSSGPVSTTGRRRGAKQQVIPTVTTKVAKLLIDAGCPVNTKDKKQRTALHRASLSGLHEIVRLLIAAGATINATDKDGDTALHDAAYKDHIKVAKLLLKAGATTILKNNEGLSPLAVAKKQKGTKVAVLLLKLKLPR
jgi:ankyrin repeat protein